MFFKNEIRKILRFPLFWIIIAVCTGFNIFLMSVQLSYERVGVKAINAYVTSGEVPSYDQYNLCADYDEVKATAYDTYYENFDIWEFKADWEELFVEKNSAAAQKVIDRNYEIVAARLDEIKSDGEARDNYYPGTTFGLHKFLYDDIFSVALFELAVTAVFMTAYLMKYEEFHSTHYSVYTSKSGRAIIFTKALAAAAASALAAVIVMTVTVAYFLILIPQSADFLKSSVSAAMATEARGMTVYPFLTWHKMSQRVYLLRASLTVVGYTVLSSVITFVVSFFSKNAYVNAVLTAMLYFSFLIAYEIVPGNNLLGFVLAFNPTAGMMSVSDWFMEYVLNPFISYPYYETWVCVGWLLLCALLTLPLWRYFKVKNIE